MNTSGATVPCRTSTTVEDRARELEIPLGDVEALRTLGVTPVHRRSFAPVKNLLAETAAE